MATYEDVAVGPAGELVLPAHLSESRPHRRAGATARYRRIALGMAVSDWIAATIGVAVGRVVLGTLPDQTRPSQLPVLFAGAVVVGVFSAYRLYRVRTLAPSDEFRRIFAAVSVSVVVLSVATNITAWIFERGHPVAITTGWLASQWVAVTVLIMAERKVWHRVMHRMKRSGALALRTVVIGSNAEGRELAGRLASPGLGFDVLGVVGPPSSVADDVIGTTATLADTIRDNEVDCAFIESSALDPADVREVLTLLRRLDVEVRVSANIPQILSSRLTVQTIGSTTALTLQTTSLSGAQAVMKRGFDVVVASFAILVTSPIWIVSAIAIKLTSAGGVLFAQDRVGRHGDVFTMYKFRTMIADAERRLSELEADPASGPLFKLQSDPRTTRVGRVLRRWSIDELPQLLNVLKGDMSIVGPRPMPARFGADYYESWHLGRLEVQPGMTGLWQVSGRSDLTFDECARLDLSYIENWSVSYDLYIILKTIPAVLQRRGAA